MPAAKTAHWNELQDASVPDEILSLLKRYPAIPDSDGIVVRQHHLGYAVFARRPIKSGELIAGFHGPIYHRERASLLPAEAKNHAIQFAPHYWRDTLPGGAARNINHSCSPNCGIAGLFNIVARRDIEIGEELFFDYAMTENSDWTVPGNRCLCGSSECRGTILPFRELPAASRQNYFPHLSEWLRDSNP